MHRHDDPALSERTTGDASALPDPALATLYRQATAPELASPAPGFDRTWAAAASPTPGPRAEQRLPALLLGGGALLAALLLTLAFGAFGPSTAAPSTADNPTELATASPTPTPASPSPFSDDDWGALAQAADDLWTWQAPTDTLIDDLPLLDDLTTADNPG
ncbi:hypothetical protein DL240_15685 [Lujinxingia litoralis]|uniref:Uncharacterized protein n=1 Tax=Lujinxingia litoralis TaxID=2211119 RepID=A0A328C2U7_9DELT|nr:hypothetical protein [Lujinxingia litoralis]RAL20757.1 hypothetical protein DL240_15685 [Lujinxingia litoralis]